jgi:hypothetical protein
MTYKYYSKLIRSEITRWDQTRMQEEIENIVSKDVQLVSQLKFDSCELSLSQSPTIPSNNDENLPPTMSSVMLQKLSPSVAMLSLPSNAAALLSPSVSTSTAAIKLLVCIDDIDRNDINYSIPGNIELETIFL